MAKELTKSSSNLNEVSYSGRPRDEEPHVKRTTKKKSEKIEYIVRVDLDELKIDDDGFDDLQSLYQLFDLDKDGILSCKEFEKLLRCLGYRLQEDQVRDLASTVSVDKTHFSVSFNEFLTLVSMQEEREPDEETLVQVFESFDKAQIGMISESVFKQIMSGKDNIHPEDINEMLDEYYRLAKLKGLSTSRPEGVKVDDVPPPPPPPKGGKRRASKSPAAASKEAAEKTKNRNSVTSQEIDEKWIDYKEFSAMLQQ